MRGMKPSICHRNHRYCHREVQSRESVIARDEAISSLCHRERSAMCPLGMSISPFIVGKQKREIASRARNDKKYPKGRRCHRAPRSCHREVQSRESVIARYEAISPFIVGEQKREIASQARNDNTKKPGDLGCPRLAGRKARLLCRKSSCHREERSDLAFYRRQTEKRDCFASSQ